MLTQIAFIVWRESVEALLVIGILHAWLGYNAAASPGRRYLWYGVVAGLATAVLLAFLILAFSEVLSGGDRLEYFQTGLVLFAAALIVQMVFWMRRYGHTLKRQLEGHLDAAVQTGRWWMIFVLAMIAVAREGSETVVFLYGMLAVGSGTDTGHVVFASLIGFLLALATYGILQLGGRILSWRLFFRVTEIMLLLLACALLVTGIGNFVSLGFLPYTDPLWNTSALLNDMGRLGGIIAALTGYRAMPDMATVATWIIFWTSVTIAIWHQNRVLSALHTKPVNRSNS